jgi:hypothetical protein
MLRARVCDPAGPRWWRVAATVGTLPLTGLLLVPGPTAPRMAAVLVGVAWLAAGRLVVPRLRTRACQVAVEPGAIVLRNAGLVSQRIAAGDLRAASTSQLPGRQYAMALVRHDEGDATLWLELASRDDLERVRRALGVGHAGFGLLRWPPQRGIFHTRATAADGVASVGWLAIVLAACMGWPEAALGLALAVVPLTLVAMVLATAPRPEQHGLALTPWGINPVVGGHASFVKWSAVRDAVVQGAGIQIWTGEGGGLVPMPGALPVELEHMAAQIRSSARRARGEGPPPAEVPASVAVLAPRDEGSRAWLQRIDATAASMGARSGGYRHAGVDPRDLWTVLESPDAPATLRAAAARVLARIAPKDAGKRIARALAMEHDGDARTRIRVALEEDVDVAARALDRLEEVG